VESISHITALSDEPCICDLWGWMHHCSAGDSGLLTGSAFQGEENILQWEQPHSLVHGLGGIPYNCLYSEALPKRGTFFSPRIYESAGISRVEVYLYERVGKSVI